MRVINIEALYALAEKWESKVNPIKDYEFDPGNTDHLMDKAQRHGIKYCSEDLRSLINMLAIEQ